MKRGADRHYPVLTVSEIIKAVLASPFWHPAKTGCHLWLWATSNFLPEAIQAIQALGFRYVSSSVWVKEGHGGLGQYLRHRHEHLLLGRMGKTMLPPPSSRPLSVIEAPRRGHSVKPDEAYSMIEAVSPGPRLEMFARRPRAGWTVWGDEISKHSSSPVKAQLGG